MIILRVIGVVLGLLFMAGAVKALTHDDGPTIKKVVPIGGKELTIPTDTPKNPFAVTRAALREMGYLPWYQSCVVGQARRLLTPHEAKRLARLPQPQREKAELAVALKGLPNCEEPGRDLVDPEASSNQLSFVREQTAVSLKALLAKEGVGEHLRNCFANRIRWASDAQTIELANGSETTQEEIFGGLFKPCYD